MPTCGTRRDVWQGGTDVAGGRHGLTGPPPATARATAALRGKVLWGGSAPHRFRGLAGLPLRMGPDLGPDAIAYAPHRVLPPGSGGQAGQLMRPNVLQQDHSG
ncbi:hypothetical protein FRACA_2960005 [Frankia canadensis]|uniref:Uncharacterized protein n=1 Tax=Frankia canadensis TaxID=1836972 RepID=A0A2I2KTH7_9ACTN|nr:hypothetical protein FRACA_2960005 [Frankia canadensis]SOU56263.1 hypothetical protein FRACA_2960005 [Frankia canadensis]